MNKIIILIMFMCMIGLVTATNTTITDIECVGDAKIKIEFENSNLNQYQFKGCDTNDISSVCNCDSVKQLILITPDNISNTYNIKLQYYIGEINQSNSSQAEIQNDALIRNKEFNNIKVNKIEIKEEPVTLPPLEDGTMIFFIIGGVILFILGIFIAIIANLFKEEKEESIFKKYYTDEEIYNHMINRYK